MNALQSVLAQGKNLLSQGSVDEARYQAEKAARLAAREKKELESTEVTVGDVAVEDEYLPHYKKSHLEVQETPVEETWFLKRSIFALVVDLMLWILLTAYASALWALGKGKLGYDFFTCIYVFVTLRLLARHVSMTKCVYEPIGWCYTKLSNSGLSRIPSWIYNVIIGGTTLVVMVIVAVAAPVDATSSVGSRLQSFTGVIVFLLFMALTSRNIAIINWRTVAVGLLAQYLIALFVLKSQLGVDIFSYMSNLVTGFLELSALGTGFLIGSYNHLTFAASVLPAIIFFCSFISVVYYFGGMQYLVAKMGWFFMITMDTSGAESIVACASPFIGQGESALMVRPFVEYMTNSELHSTMTSGFATIAGSVLLAYVGMVGEGGTKTLLTACVMSIPASLLLSKMRYPETEEPITKGKAQVPVTEEKEANFLHAAGNGSATGIQLALLIFGSLLALYSLFKAADYVFGWLFFMVDIFDWVQPVSSPTDAGDFNFNGHKWVSIELVLSYVFWPVAWLVGINPVDARQAGALMALKMTINEFVAYSSLHDLLDANSIEPRTVHLMTFALCGFANIASIGIQIGCLGVIAPTRRRDLAQLAVSAMLTGTVSTWLTAAVAGTLM